MAGSGGGVGTLYDMEVVLGHRDNREDQVTVTVKLPRGCTMGQLHGTATRVLQDKGDWDHRLYITNRWLE